MNRQSSFTRVDAKHYRKLEEQFKEEQKHTKDPKRRRRLRELIRYCSKQARLMEKNSSS